MKFKKICPKCLKTYANGTISKCGRCKVKLREIGQSSIVIDGDMVKITYKFIE